jgi:lipoprotein-anchoring transpeptidase ErfK/SrfK
MKCVTTGLIRSLVLLLVVSAMALGLWRPETLGYAQTNEDAAIVFPSGHWLDDTYGFLSYWRVHNGATILGAPVTGPLEEHGLVVQYFERGRLEQHVGQDGVAYVLPGRVGADYAAELWLVFHFEAPALEKPSGRADFSESQNLPAVGEKVFETGYSISEPFMRFWLEHGGVETFGFPISQPLWEYVGDELLLVQYFERTRLERHVIAQDTYDIRISSLGRDLALLRGYDMTPPEPGNVMLVPVNNEGVATVTPPPTPTHTPEPLPTPEPTVAPPAPTATPPSAAAAPGAAPASKYIVVNLSAQWLYAYEGDYIVFEAPVSTGRDGFNTPTGTFSIYAKYPSQTMSGNLGGESYYVPNVPHVMYIYGGVALHGTYWHNQFGTGVRMSHGCINLPLESAAWLYNWAPIGTTVYVRY